MSRRISHKSLKCERVAKTWLAGLLKTGEASNGGRAVRCIGYEDAKQWFHARNYWSLKCYMKSCFSPPFYHLLSANLASDFWTIRVDQ